MKCPNCSKENHIGARVCFDCREALPIDTTLRIRTSKIAVISAALALTAICITVSLTLYSPPGRRPPRIPSWIWPTATLAPATLALVLGSIALIRIGTSGGRLVGRGFAVIGTAIPMVIFLVAMLMPALTRTRSVAFRMVCGTNLSGMGRAMLIYANDYEDELPRAGAKNSVWRGPVDFDATTRQAAYGTDAAGNGGKATITSCFYLLVKYAEVTPKSFLCDKDKGVREFKPAKYGLKDRELIDLWDFGPNPVVHCSYSMHLPFDKYALTTSSDPGMAVAADRNPWMPSPFHKPKDKSKFGWANREQVKYGNAYAHQDEGQNVLFRDSHVAFEKTPLCGINEDNIWTYWDGGDIRVGTVPTVGQQINVVGNRRQDSVLVTDGTGNKGK